MTDGNYIQFQVPGLQYSVVRIDIDPAVDDDAIIAQIDRAAWFADVLANSITARFATIPAGAPEPAYDDIPEPNHPNAPRPQQRAQQPNPMPSMNNYGGAKFYCPIHNEELRPSLRNKTMDWDDALQMDVPASWFHTVDGKTCSVYRSKAQIRMPAHAG